MTIDSRPPSTPSGESPFSGEVPRHRSRKNRRRWCKGKAGVEHQWGEWYVIYEHFGCLVCRVLERIECQVCGKRQLRSRPQ